jgi:hypothetical protein
MSKNIEQLQKDIQKKQNDLTDQTIKQLTPVVYEITKIITDAKLPIGNVHAHDNPKFAGVARDVIGVMLDGNVKYLDRNLLFQLVLQQFDGIREMVTKSLSESLIRAETKLFRKEFTEVSLKDLDKIIKEPVA